MKKTIVTMAALMLMAGGAMACAQQPEKKSAPEATEASAPADQAKPEADGAAADSTAGESAKEESKVESESTSEGNSSSASEAPASSAE